MKASNNHSQSNDEKENDLFDFKVSFFYPLIILIFKSDFVNDLFISLKSEF